MSDEVKDFDAWRSAKLGKPIMFKLAGEVFEVPRKLSSVGAFDFIKRQRSMAESLGRGETLPMDNVEDNINWAFLKYQLPETVFDHLVEVCRREAIDAETIAAICDHIIEESTGRPLVTSTVSSELPLTNGRSSKVGSSSKASSSTTSPRGKRSLRSTPSASKTGR